jgi:hypothetical protein
LRRNFLAAKDLTLEKVQKIGSTYERTVMHSEKKEQPKEENPENETISKLQKKNRQQFKPFSQMTLKGPGAWISKFPAIVLEFNPLPQKNIRNLIQFGLCIEFNHIYPIIRRQCNICTGHRERYIINQTTFHFYTII